MSSVVFVVACAIAGLPPAPAAVADPVAEYVRRFLDETLIESRFLRPYQMEYHVIPSYPEQKPKVYSVRGVYRYAVDPPNCRAEIVLGPFEPIKQAPVRHIRVTNGTSEVDLLYTPEGRQNRALVTRDRESRDSARRNKFFTELGIPVTNFQLEEGRHGWYWLRDAVTIKNGYAIAPDRETIAGIECVVIKNDKDDTIWFSAAAPIWLIKRDTWHKAKTPNRQVLEFFEYTDQNLPAKIVHTHYVEVDCIGESSQIQAVETLFLDDFKFVSTPAEDFVLTIDDYVGIADANTRMTFQTAPPATPPFEKLLRQVQTQPQPNPPSQMHWLVDVNMLALSGLALVHSLRRWARPTNKRHPY